MKWLIGAFLYVMGFGLSMAAHDGAGNWQKDIGEFIFSNCILMAVIFGGSFLFNRSMPLERRAEMAFLSASIVFVLIVAIGAVLL